MRPNKGRVGTGAHVFRCRMSEAEREMLRTLADRDGVTASDVVRQLVRRAAQDVERKRRRSQP